MRRTLAVTLGLALLVVTPLACTGSIGDELLGRASGAGDDAGAPPVSDAPTTFTCDPSQKPPVDALRLLTAAQYRNTLTDWIAWTLADPSAGKTVLSEVAGAMNGLAPNLPVVPQNDTVMAVLFPDGGYLRADQDQQFLRVQAYYAIGGAVGAALTSPSRLAKLAGSCATDGDASNDASCLASFIAKVGPRALRRPLGADDVAFFTSVYGSDPKADPAAYADVVAAMLNAPDFLYFVEHGDQPVAGQDGVFSLSAHELASRLSYQLWDTMPDDALWAKADDGSLLQDAVYAKEVDRLLADPRAHAAARAFFFDYLQFEGTGGARGKGGLNYHDLASYDADPVFKAFAGDALPSPALSPAMVDEALAMIDYYAFTKPGTVDDLLESDLAFPKSAELAKLYGVPTWDGTSPPPAFPSGQRPGLFTRAAFVAAGVNTTPILKGVFLRRYVLCDDVGKPPPAAANAKVVLSDHATTREMVTELTGGSPCNACHTTLINPLGFVTEGFDGLGRARTTQALFHPDGTSAGSLPIDTSAAPHVQVDDDATQVVGPADLATLVAKSGKLEACLARNYFRHTFARFEDVTRDGCTLESLRQTLDRSKGPGLLQGLLKQVVLTPAFKRRTFQ